MHNSFNRRTSTKFKDGQVQRKNRQTPTVHLGYVLDRESPGKGFRHALNKRDLQTFIEIIPDWSELALKLECIILAAPDSELDGCYEFHRREKTGSINLFAWPEDFWLTLNLKYFKAHQHIFQQLGVSFEISEEKAVCRFTDAQARAYMLLHIFLHELGHHHHRSRMKHHSTNFDEDYAENFANRRFVTLFPSYVKIFGDPAKSG